MNDDPTLLSRTELSTWMPLAAVPQVLTHTLDAEVVAMLDRTPSHPEPVPAGSA